MTTRAAMVEAVQYALDDAKGILSRVPYPWLEKHAEALAAVLEALEAEAWRPIETAPRDGTHVLGYGPHETRGHYITDVHHFGSRWTIEWMHGYGAPTHWRPLPPPPESAG